MPQGPRRQAARGPGTRARLLARIATTLGCGVLALPGLGDFAPQQLRATAAEIVADERHPPARLQAGQRFPATATLARAARCPWASTAGTAGKTPGQLAAEVLSHMDLAEELELVVIHYHGPYQNWLVGLPRLCIPSLVLQDGAAGIAYHAGGVTQLPAPLGVGASFDTSLAGAYGFVEGEEARRKGIDVLQSPNLNLVRVPEDGRAFETYGEDPELASALGVAVIRAIQSTGVVAEATHLTAYTQETDRSAVDQVVSQRALQEVYLAPFRAAVEQGRVGSVMCAYGEVDGVRECQNTSLLDELASWGFTGLVRSDLQAVDDFAAAFDAGVDAVKPGGRTTLRQLVDEQRIPRQVIDHAVLAILQTMFRFGLIVHPLRKQPLVAVTTPADASLALRAAEESMVLLKNDRGVLPLSARTASVALIGTDAGSGAMSAGQGGAYVLPPFVDTPVSAIGAALAAGSELRYVAGDSPTAALAAIPAAAQRLRSVDLLASVVLGPARAASQPARSPEAGSSAVPAGARRVVHQLLASGATGTGSIPASDFPDLDHLELTVVPPASGLYAISLTGQGDQWLELDGKPLLSDPGVHFSSTWQVATELRAGRSYELSLHWFPEPLEGIPAIGWQDETPAIDKAVAAARSASVAVVFADAPSSEGVDRPDLSLPGAQDALISAVASANPRTVVVLDTPGAVLMPWLSSVRAVLEAFYPGEQDGTATAAVLFGSVDPSGRLPVTFPAAGDGVPGGTAAAWPGVDNRVDFSEGLDIGYRYELAKDLTPLFPFGFGLSYTSFALSALSAKAAPGRMDVEVRVTNTGQRSGAEVVEAYLGFPAAALEPPLQLAGFGRVALAPGQSRSLRLQLPSSAFEAYLHGGFHTVPGTYELRVGTSSADLPLSVALQAP